MSESVDLLVVHGKIYSVDSADHVFEAMAIRNGKICDLGNSKELKDRYKAVKLLDAGGMPVFPGFIDAHCHFFGFALNQQY
ncbi:MAG: amidohydrolase, partial [Bacteroidota bacterium]